MKTVNINLENQNILVIGGGKKAYEMGKQFENVKYLSPNFIDEIEEGYADSEDAVVSI